MSKKTRYLFGILLTIVIGTILMWFYCCKTNTEIAIEETARDQDNQEKVVAEIPSSTTTNMGFTIKDHDPDGNIAYTSNDNFNFSFSDFNIQTPISQGVTEGIDILKAHLNNHADKSIDVTGFYTSQEANTSAFPNLGIARANTIKNYLRSKGISSKQINIFGKEDNSLTIIDSLYLGPVNYGIRKIAKNNQEAEELAALKKNINDNPLTLHFGNAQTSINLSVAQRQKIADISRYLDKIEDSSITIEGHTDNTGTRATNIPLGKKRADFIKGYFVRNGISETKISTTSKGPDEPIATNATEEGRSKNRRSIVTIN